MKDFGNDYMYKDNLLFEIAKKLDLDAEEHEMLVHDVNNLRGDEWIEEIETLDDGELIEAFKELIHYHDDETYVVLIKHPTDESLDEYETYNSLEEAKERFERLKNSLLKKDINDGLYVSYAKVQEIFLYNEDTEEEYEHLNLSELDEIEDFSSSYDYEEI